MSQRGFSLLEVLVAFAVLALSLGVLMRIFSGALNNIAVSREQTEALALAQTLLAGAGVETPLAAGELSGQQGERLQWRLTMTRFGLGQEARRPGAPPYALWEIDVRVSWQDRPEDSGRAVVLKTLRAGKESGP